MCLHLLNNPPARDYSHSTSLRYVINRQCCTCLCSSSLPWAAAAFLIRKENRKFHFICDFHILNKVTPIRMLCQFRMWMTSSTEPDMVPYPPKLISLMYNLNSSSIKGILYKVLDQREKKNKNKKNGALKKTLKASQASLENRTHKTPKSQSQTKVQEAMGEEKREDENEAGRDLGLFLLFLFLILLFPCCPKHLKLQHHRSIQVLLLSSLSSRERAFLGVVFQVFVLRIIIDSLPESLIHVPVDCLLFSCLLYHFSAMFTAISCCHFSCFALIIDLYMPLSGQSSRFVTLFSRYLLLARTSLQQTSMPNSTLKKTKQSHGKAPP